MSTRQVMIDEEHRASGRRRAVRWTKAMREDFLDRLAATCNVAQSAAFIGVLPGSIYQLRRREPAFAQAWHDALALGYEMLETQLVGHALAGDEGRELTNGGMPAMGPISVDLALRLITWHRDAKGKPRAGGAPRQRATSDETNRAILAKLDAIEKRRAKAAQLGAAETAAGVEVATDSEAEPAA